MKSNPASKLAQEDPALKVFTDRESGHNIIGGMGESHLQNVVDRVLREHNVEVHMGRQRIAVRETIRKPAEGEGRYLEQTSGRDNYGHVKLRIEPIEGYEFVGESKGGVVPSKYIDAVERGVSDAMRTGVLAGHRIVNVKAVLCDGSFHELHSNEMPVAAAHNPAPGTQIVMPSSVYT